MQDKQKGVQGHNKTGLHPVAMDLELRCLAPQWALATESTH